MTDVPAAPDPSAHQPPDPPDELQNWESEGGTPTPPWADIDDEDM